MWKWLGIILGTLISVCQSQKSLAAENLAMRQQLATLKHRHPRPQLTRADRLFWLLLFRIWGDWRNALHIVQPETVIRWHRQGFRYYWAWKSRRVGRPRIDPELRQLIREMIRDNPLLGAPRIHGELLKLGFEVSQATVSKYMLRNRRPPSQSWRTFLRNHQELISLDFLTVPTATFRILFVLVILIHDRRRILHINVTAHPTAAWTAHQLLGASGLDKVPRYLIRDRDSIYGKVFARQASVLGIEEVVTAPQSPWQNAYAERVIGSIRRECLDHVIVLGEWHLYRILSGYIDYYNQTRTHLSLEKDAPERRSGYALDQGNVVNFLRVGGLHHEYGRMAA